MRDYDSRIRLFIAIILAPVYLAGCMTTAGAPVADADPASASHVTENGNINSGAEGIRQALYDQLRRWQDTGYRRGGLGERGIDCSGLTYVVYRDLFGRHLPRTTEQQGEVGHSVKRRDLAPGDLVFFKTGFFQRHVGIYVEDGMFLHASGSNGVRISSLASDYWRKRYWKARRLDRLETG